MKNKDFDHYHVASISGDEITSITNLEKQLSEKANKPIVLIAYQPLEESNTNIK